MLENQLAIKKSKILIYLLSFLQFQGFIGPVLFVFYSRHLGLSMDEYLKIDAVCFLAMAFCEIPSGMIADTFGRKKVLIISKVFLTVGMMNLLFTKSYLGALVTSLIYGVFGALESGVSESVIYEIFDREKKLKEYEYTTSKAGSIGFFVSILYAVFAGYLVSINILLPVILDLIVLSLMILLILIFLEDNGKYSGEKKGACLKIPLSECLNILPILSVAAILVSFSRCIFSFYQPIQLELELPVVFLGYAAAFYSIIAGGSAFFYKKIREKFPAKFMFFLIAVLQFVSSFGLAFSKSYAALGFIFLQQLMRGIMGVFLYFQINSFINPGSKNRVTLMSVYYFVTTILTGIMLKLTADFTKLQSMRFSIKTYSLLINSLLVISLLVLFICKKTGKIKRYQEC